MPLKYFLKTLLLLLFCVFAGIACYARQNAGTPTNYGPFYKILSIKTPGRIDSARKIYRLTGRKLSAPDAMALLDKLTRLAQDIEDKQLECAVYDMRADYYSVNNGYNNNSTRLYLQAINFAVRNNLPVEEGIYMHRLAVYFSIYNRNTQAINYLLKSLDLFKRIGYDKVPDMSLYFYQVAGFYYDIKDYDNASNFSFKSLQYRTANNRVTINTITVIGLVYRNQLKYAGAIAYFNKALNMATIQKDSAWIGISMGNIGSVYFLQNQYQKALPYITTDYRTSLKYGETYNAALALLRLIAINIAWEKFSDAGKQIHAAENLMGNSTNNLALHVELYRLKSLYYEKTGNLPAAFSYRKQFDIAKDSLKKQENLGAVENIKLKWQQEKYRNRIKQIESKASAKAFERDAMIAVIILIAVIIGLIYNRKLLQAKTAGELLKIEKLRVDQELSNAAAELTQYTHNIQQKNTIIQEFIHEVEHLNMKFEDKEKADQLNNLLQAHIMTDAGWSEFKRLFIRVYPDFFTKMKERYPVINDTDQRMLALIKLNLNNREMAGMLGITSEGIKKAKQRLRKKMKLSNDISIESAVITA